MFLRTVGSSPTTLGLRRFLCAQFVEFHFVGEGHVQRFVTERKKVAFTHASL